MAQILTLLQVRGSPQFAWHPHGYLWVDGRLFRAVRLEPPATGGYQGVLTVKRSALRDGDHTIDGGWRHGEGCRCDLCADPTATPPRAFRAARPLWLTRLDLRPDDGAPRPRGHGEAEKRPTSSRAAPRVTARRATSGRQRSMLPAGTVE